MLFTDTFQLKLDAHRHLCQEWGVLLSLKELSFLNAIYWLSPLTEPFLGHLEDKAKSLAVMDNVFCKSKLLDILPPRTCPYLVAGSCSSLNFHTKSIV